ncbi:hypothetical protein C8046_09620 [Serinibacter arcticus]|uniref:Glycosyltransferase n=1 Tax=Serinibacter arcticus TaxID=1655435 RepID=A0A2U1ZV81_9MICO|nr:glycosyltransferase [Serinibacter arcticus]PWD50871.1 hypothetical protein C8046_09620 [Serinibacter arcticus]
MKVALQGWQHSSQSPLREALAQLRWAQELSAERPIVLGYTPVARMNPFQSQLYRSFPECGIGATPVLRPEQLGAVGQLAPLAQVAVHLHWLGGVLAGIDDRAAARRATADFLGRLDRFRDEGGSVAWTIHNLLPHDAVLEDAEQELRQGVAERCDAVHVMSAHTVDLLRGSLVLDESRVLHVPHPSYADCYASNVTRADARGALGIEPHERVFVLLGAIKAYKGLSLLLRAFDRYARDYDGDARLLVAGAPDDSEAARAFVAVATAHPRVLIQPAKIPADQVQLYLRAADVGLAPYERVLNSGATHLYETFGLPCVVPDQPQALETLHPHHRAAFRPGDESGLVAALQRAGDMVGPQVQADVEAHARHEDPATLSRDLATGLRRLFTAGGPS